MEDEKAVPAFERMTEMALKGRVVLQQESRRK